MGISLNGIFTHLPLCRYAEIMALHPDAFNQVINPAAPYPGCNRVWYQNGWMNQIEGMIIGREDVAQAIHTAEEQIADALGFAVAPGWVTGEEQPWPLPARGAQTSYPPIQLDWGYIIAGGQRALTTVALGRAVNYFDTDGDGVFDEAQITVTAAEILTAAVADNIELAVFFHDETDDCYWIRCLRAVEDVAGNVTFIGRRSEFVDPDLWAQAVEIELDDAASFVPEVDVYRRWNDPQSPAQVVWKGGGDACVTTACAETCQTACLSIEDYRLSIVHVIPGTYAAGTWSTSSFSECRLPDAIHAWYYCGLDLDKYGRIRPRLAEAIVRLANTYLVDMPCGCAATKFRWDRDREEMDMNSYDAQLAMSAFGSTMRGAIFAWSVVKRIPPIAHGGALS